MLSIFIVNKVNCVATACTDTALPTNPANKFDCQSKGYKYVSSACQEPSAAEC